MVLEMARHGAALGCKYYAATGAFGRREAQRAGGWDATAASEQPGVPPRRPNTQSLLERGLIVRPPPWHARQQRMQ